MKIYYYVHTGHRVGLDRFRRACAIINSLGDIDITLLCSDFRIASEAKSFGIKKAVGIDLVTNIPKIALHGDKIIFDSDEANPLMLEDMRNFFSIFIRISQDEYDKKADNEFLISPYLSGKGVCQAVPIDKKYFVNEEKNIKLSYFFGDDDYEKDLEKNIDFIQDLNPDLQLGYYYFLDYEEKLKNMFKKSYDFSDYEEVIKKSEILITASPQAALESLASGGKPIFIQRDGYTTSFVKFFKELKIPIVEKYNKTHLLDIIDSINSVEYFKMEQNSDKIAVFIKETLNL